MAFYAKRAGITGGSCCDCSQYIGCDCGGASCAVECRSKADNAALCGYEEFGTPSVPAKKFRKKTIAGTMYSGEWSAAGCPNSNGDPVAYSGSFSGGVGFWGDASGSMSAEPVEIDLPNNRVKYRVTAKSFTPNSSFTGWGNMTNIQLAAGPNDGGPSQVAVNVGNEFWVSRGAAQNPWNFFIQGIWSLAGGIGHLDTDLEIDVSKVIDRSVRDEWNITNEFANEPGCAPTETDTSARYAKEFAEFRLNSGGDEESWAGFGGTPLEGYGALAEVTEETSTTRKTSGKGDCQGASAPYQKAEGDVTETLETEDTEEDAYNRSAAGLEWSTVGPCSNHTTYITERGEILGPYGFGYRIAQVRAICGNLVIGQTYTVTIRIWRRAFDSSSPWAAFAELTLVLSSVVATTVTTEWQDVPIERGYETRAMSCSCIVNA